jgi:drug/metabolite transporter (DMT)-like permease
MFFVGLIAALGATVLFNLGIALQALDARAAPPKAALRFSLLPHLLRKRRWVLGLLVGGLGFPLEVFAFAETPFVVVQPMLAAGLLLLLVLGARTLGERVSPTDIGGVVAMICGIALIAWGAPASTEAQRSPVRVGMVVALVAAASFVPFFLRSRRGEPAIALILGSALGFGTSSIAAKLLGDGLKVDHYLLAVLWLAVAAGTSLAAVVTEMTALQRRPATMVVPISFSVQTFIPILLAPMFLREHLSSAAADGVPLLAGLLLVLVASVVIARRPAVSLLVAGKTPADHGTRGLLPRGGSGRAIHRPLEVDDPGALRASRRIAVVPAYNEEPTVASVLGQLYELADELVVVDDGSTDNTRKIVEKWLTGRDRARLLTLDRNQGMSAAYYLAFSDLRSRMPGGEIHADDLIYTVDADGQHDLSQLAELERIVRSERLDALLARRDLSSYSPYKRLGNRVASGWASLWARRQLDDVESGYRIFRVGALVHALDYYKGYRYSETVEVAVVLCRLGYRVRNDVLVPVPVIRSRTRFVDAVIDLVMIPAASLRVARRRRGQRSSRPASAVATALGMTFLALSCLHIADRAIRSASRGSRRR